MTQTLAETMAGEIRAELARQGKSMTDLANALGWSQRRVYYRLAGESEIRMSELLVIAAYLGVPVAQLMPGVGAGSAA